MIVILFLKSKDEKSLFPFFEYNINIVPTFHTLSTINNAAKVDKIKFKTKYLGASFFNL